MLPVARDKKPMSTSPSKHAKSAARQSSKFTTTKSAQNQRLLAEGHRRDSLDDDFEEEEVDEAFEPTGNFLSDFRILCQKRGLDYIPPIIPRSDQPSLFPQVEEKVEETKKTKKTQMKIKQSKKSNVLRVTGSMLFQGKTDLATPPEEAFVRPGAKGKATRIDQQQAPEGAIADKAISFDSVGTTTKSLLGTPQSESGKMLTEGMVTGPGDESLPAPSLSLYLTLPRKDNLEYFKPCIQVIQGIHGDGDIYVTEIYIRGWMIDMNMMSIFQVLWPPMPWLQTVNLWNVGLGAESLNLLNSFLPLCSRLATLVLDGNALQGLAVGGLLEPEACLLRHLSLRFCRLTAPEAYGLSTGLAHPRCPLLTLNLSTNNLGDPGVTFLARALRLNRSLLTLNLTNNKFGDKGAIELATALTEFQLDQQQVVERRRLLGLLEDKENMEVAARMAQAALKADAPSSDRKTKKAGPTSSTKGGKMTHTGKAEAMRRANAVTLAKKAVPKGSTHPPSGRKSSDEKAVGEKQASERTSSRGSLRSASLHQLHMLDSAREKLKLSGGKSKARNLEQELDSPLLDTTRYCEGNLYLVGNRTLISLNVSRNHIGVAGMRSMLSMVEEHIKPLHGSTQAGRGLRRLVLHHNQVPEADCTYKLINQHMRLRDPFFKSPRIDLEKTNITPCSVPLAF